MTEYLSSYDYALIATALEELDADGSEATARKQELEAWARQMAETGRGYLPPCNTADPIRVLVALEGGVISGTVADRPGVEIVALDYDTEGADDEDLFDIPQDSGGTAEAFRAEHTPEIDAGFIARARAARPSDPEKRLDLLRRTVAGLTEEGRASAWGAATIRELEELEKQIAAEELEQELAA
jgi:hypothetical protein